MARATHLNLSHLSSGLHPAGNVDGVAPDVVLRLLCAHHAGHHAALVQASPELEPLEAVPVDVFQKGPQLDGELNQDGAVVVLAESLKNINDIFWYQYNISFVLIFTKQVLVSSKP